MQENQNLTSSRFDPVKQLSKQNMKIAALRQANDELRAQLDRYKATGSIETRLTNLTAELKASKRSLASVQNNLDRERAARQSAQSDLKVAVARATEAERLLAARDQHIATVEARERQLESERAVLSRECLASQDRLIELERDSKHAKELAAAALEWHATDIDHTSSKATAAATAAADDLHITAKVRPGYTTTGTAALLPAAEVASDTEDEDEDGLMSREKEEAEEDQAELVRIEATFERILAGTRGWALNNDAVMRQAIKFSEDVLELWGRRGDAFLDAADRQRDRAKRKYKALLNKANAAIASTTAAAVATGTTDTADTAYNTVTTLTIGTDGRGREGEEEKQGRKRMEGATDLHTCLGLVEGERRRMQDRAGHAERRLAVGALFTFTVRELTLEKERRESGEVTARAESSEVRLQLEEVDADRARLAEESEHWQTENSYATLFNACACLYSAAVAANVHSGGLRWAFCVLLSNWVCLAREERLAGALEDVQTRYEALQASSKAEVGFSAQLH